jgi:hypothetical protein
MFILMLAISSNIFLKKSMLLKIIYLFLNCNNDQNNYYSNTTIFTNIYILIIF